MEKFKLNSCYCPLCNSYFKQSNYLSKVITNENTLWMANMVTHYRHHHITSWNKCWRYNGKYYRGEWFKDYDYEKRKVNERAKRQIMRKGKLYLQSIKFCLDDLLLLQDNSSETINLAKKTLIH